MKLVVISISLWLLTLPFAFAQKSVQHEIGVEMGVGVSGVLFPNDLAPERLYVVQLNLGVRHQF